MNSENLDVVRKKLNQFSRIKLIHTPTPFNKLENLSKELGGPEIFIKRDDMTGLAFGGNKSRKLEYILPDVVEKKCDMIITWASIQSNWCLQTAAAARKIGITPVLILFKTNDLPEEMDGNLLLDFILDADIKIKNSARDKKVSTSDVNNALTEAVKEAEANGFSPYVAPIGGSMVGWSMDKPLGAVSYVNAGLELQQQAGELDLEIDYIIHASGSGSTQAGLAVGAKAIWGKTKVLGISVLENKKAYQQDVLTIAEDTVKALDFSFEIAPEDIIVFDEYIQDGYGVVNKTVADAVRLAALTEGIFLDPVYTGKALVALIDLIKQGFFNSKDKVVLMHTGGIPALFPNKHLLAKHLKM